MINRGFSKWIAVGLLVLTVGQLAIAAFVPGLDQFEGKGFGARLGIYPIMMLVVPTLWWLRNGRPGTDRKSAESTTRPEPYVHPS